MTNELPTNTALRNNNVLVTIQLRAANPRPFLCITARDLLDGNNEPVSFTQSKRGIRKVWDAIEAAFNDTTRHGTINSIFRDMGVKYHYYCAMD